MDLKSCLSALDNFAGKRVLVVGDLMLDEHVWGTVSRVSPEAPVMVVNADSTDARPGGAANVAKNIRALGAKACVVGVIGDDETGRILRDRLVESGVEVDGLFIDKSRPTTRKSRIWASHRHQVVRVDWEDKRKIATSIVRRVIEFIDNVSDIVDAILLSDYDKGVVAKEIVRASIKAANDHNKMCVSNAKPRNLSYFTDIGLITMNRPEATAASGVDISSASDVERAGRKILATTGCRGLVITTGAQGLSAFSSNGCVDHIPAVKSEVYDEAGAGDTVVSALTLALTGGLDLAGAGAIANCAGGAVVRKVGVATTTIEEIGALLSASWTQLASG
ncbi:MAG: PfkB family carbohydrate kinase [Armatimonadota bacterium]|nr:PfkB family carbohydrate kinase [bacterium]